jgi:hypothetical protein
MMDWPLGEFFGGFNNFNGSFNFGESGTSKVVVEQLAFSITTNLFPVDI